jgi:hypothetical protein
LALRYAGMPRGEEPAARPPALQVRRRMRWRSDWRAGLFGAPMRG